MGVANVVIAQIVVLQRRTTLGAQGIVADNVDRLGKISRLLANAEENSFVVRLQHAAAKLICIENQLGGIRAIGIDNTENVVRVGVAFQRIPEQIGHHQIIRLQIGENQPGSPLIHFIYCGIHPAFSHPIQAVDQVGGTAGNDVGAGPVADHLPAVCQQSVRQQIGYGCLTVGTGDADYKGCLGCQGKNFGTYFQCNYTGIMRRIPSQHPNQFGAAFCCNYRQMVS